MNLQEIDEAKTETRESRIDCQIRDIKASYNFQTFFSAYTKKKIASDYKLTEFGFGSNNFGGHVIRHYVWLSIKLMALFIAKYANRLFYQRAG